MSACAFQGSCGVMCNDMNRPIDKQHTCLWIVSLCVVTRQPVEFLCGEGRAPRADGHQGSRGARHNGMASLGKAQIWLGNADHDFDSARLRQELGAHNIFPLRMSLHIRGPTQDRRCAVVHLCVSRSCVRPRSAFLFFSTSFCMFAVCFTRRFVWTCNIVMVCVYICNHMLRIVYPLFLLVAVVRIRCNSWIRSSTPVPS